MSIVDQAQEVSQACELMTQFGFENVYNLEGGITEWSGEIIQTK